jgi:hypothetical protein
MGRYYQRQTTTETLAVGIKGDRHSLCGAIKRLQRTGKQWNGLLSLKEQCARHIALIKNEQLKCFINAYLPSNLFQYVTKDILNLRRDEFISNYPEEFELCEICMLNPEKKSRKRCQCPEMESAIHKLNNYFFKRMNDEHKTSTNQIREFQLIYKLLNDELGDWDEDDSNFYFLYIVPCEYYNEINLSNMDEDAFEDYRIVNDQISLQEKFLFVDMMRFFGGFQTDQEQPRLILYRRREFPL